MREVYKDPYTRLDDKDEDTALLRGDAEPIAIYASIELGEFAGLVAELEEEQLDTCMKLSQR